MEEQPFAQQDPINTLLSELGIRINELEEKQRLLKDRVLLVGENLIATKEDYDKQVLEFKKQIKNLESDIKSIKQLSERIVNELGNLARKSDLEILKRQAKIFQPLEFARIKDVRKIIQEELSKNKSIKNK